MVIPVHHSRPRGDEEPTYQLVTNPAAEHHIGAKATPPGLGARRYRVEVTRPSGGMADATDSKSVVRKGVWVRVPPRAPKYLPVYGPRSNAWAMATCTVEHRAEGDGWDDAGDLRACSVADGAGWIDQRRDPGSQRSVRSGPGGGCPGTRWKIPSAQTSAASIEIAVAARCRRDEPQVATKAPTAARRLSEQLMATERCHVGSESRTLTPAERGAEHAGVNDEH